MKSLNLSGTQDQLNQVQYNKDASEVRADTRLQTLLNARPAQIDTWVENNVTNLQEVQETVKLLMRIVVVLGRKTFK